MTQQRLIDLRTFAKHEHFPAYAALYCPELKTPEHVFCLSSQVMQWSENIWLLDLHSSENFWLLQQQKLQLGLFEMLQQVLEESLGQKILVVFAQHPWPALFFLDYLCAQTARENNSGIYSLESSMSQNLYENISWQHWFAPLTVLAEKLEILKVKGFHAPRFRSQQAQLQRFIERMELWGPYDLSLAKVGSLAGEIERRYSVWLARIWRWTFAAYLNRGEATQQGLQYFPWITFELSQTPKVSRLLEYPLNQWDVLEPLLIEDFQRLCHLSSWSDQERVNRIYWTITLFNWQEEVVELSFRNPYRLHAEQPHFKTALYQAYYSYMDAMLKLQQRDKDLDLPENMPFISWQLEVRERLFITPTIMELFPESFDHQVENELLELQNKLPALIESYTINPDFCSEQLFSLQEIGTGQKTAYDFPLQQWQVKLQRPLFYYQQPQALLVEQGYRQIFLERTANNWWEEDDLANLIRDYFILQEPNGVRWWGYKSSRGEWFKHGVYS